VDNGAFMSLALEEARAALEHDDVPIGCVIARGDEVVARAHNARERDADPTAHAEILALRAAAHAIGSWRLEGCTVYVTLEPCVMCAGAIVLARIPLVVFGAPDPKAGAVISIAQVFEERGLNHHPRWRMGVMRAESEALLKEFFASHRARAAD